MKTDAVPSLRTDRLYLRGVTLDDAEAYERHFVNYEVIRYLSDRVPWPYPAGGVRTFFEEFVLPRQGRDRWMWGIFLSSAPDELIGAVELWRVGVPENRGFWLAQPHWGQGYMTEACALINDVAFNQLGFDELIFTNALGNTRSERIKEKTGCERIGVKDSSFVDPQFTQSEIWRLTRASWEAHQASS